MRIERFDLVAYGPFTDQVFEFAPGRVELIYGPNGAGKSSALRGLVALLYGIEVRTTDDHVHEKSTLRVGGVLRGPEEVPLEFVRHKTRKDSLRDASGRPIDERPLERLLDGVGKELFTTMFALGHEQLRSVGREILKGSGDLAEQLFGAGLGRDVHRVVAALRAEAEEIFTRRARTKPLHLAANAYNEAKKSVRQLALRPDTWATVQHELDEKQAQREVLERRLRELRTDRTTLDRHKKVLPLLARLDELRQERADLGEVVLLAPEAPHERREAQRARDEARTRTTKLRAKIDEAKREFALLRVPEGLLKRSAQIELVEERLGAHRKATVDLTRLESKWRVAKSRARDILEEIAGHKDLELAGDFVLPAARQARIRALASSRKVLEERVRGLEEQIAGERRKVERARDGLDACPEAADIASLKTAIGDARASGDLGSQVQNAQWMAEESLRDAKNALGALGLWEGNLEEAPRMPLPTPATVARYEKLWAETERTNNKLTDDMARQEEALRQCKEQIDSLRGEGEVPTTKELARLRRHRDEGWKLVRQTWLDQEDTRERANSFDSNRPLAEAYENASHEADMAADRLHKEADRSAKYEQLLVQHQRLEQELTQFSEAHERLAEQDAICRREWQSVWDPAELEPLPPIEMRAWLERHARLLERIAGLRQLQLSYEGLVEKEATMRGELAAALDHRGDAPLAALLQQADQRVSEALENVATRKRLLEEKLRAAEALAVLDSKLGSTQAELAEWTANWQESVAGLGLGAKALPEEAEAVLDRTAELKRELDEIDNLDKRMYGIKQDAKDFALKVETLVAECAEDLESLPCERAADALLARFRKGSVDLTAREQIRKDLQEKDAQLQEWELKATNADEILTRMVVEARCETDDALEAAERVSQRARALDDQIEHVRDRILELGAGAAVETLRAQLEGVDADALPAQIGDINEEIAQIEQERGVLGEEIGRRKSDIERMDGGPAAAEAAARAQEELARTRSLAWDYARYRLAGHLLEREIEAYRKANQGPLLERAGEILQKLSLRRFERLLVEHDAEGTPSLLCVRNDGMEVSPAVLSDGETDQLYLALRVAGLERHMKSNRPLPFIADDIYVNFDDDRARAGFEILGELAQRTQVIFLTHHPRLRELAREALDDESIGLHELPGIVT